MRRIKYLEMMACGLQVLALSACYIPDHSAHATLTVATNGQYAFQGQAATAEQLPVAIARAASGAAKLVVEIQASPTASMQAVQTAVDAVKAAKAHVAFSGATAAK